MKMRWRWFWRAAGLCGVAESIYGVVARDWIAFVSGIVYAVAAISVLMKA